MPGSHRLAGHESVVLGVDGGAGFADDADRADDADGLAIRFVAELLASEAHVVRTSLPPR